MDDVMVFVVVMVAAVVATCVAVWIICLYQDVSDYRLAVADLSAEADRWMAKYHDAVGTPATVRLADLMAGWVGSCRECGKDRPLGDATGLCYDCQESELEGLLDDMASLVAKVMPPDEVDNGHAAVVAALNGALCDLCGTKYVLGSDDHNGETGICNDCDARDAERDRIGGRPWVDYDATPPFGIVRFPLGEV